MCIRWIKHYKCGCRRRGLVEPCLKFGDTGCEKEHPKIKFMDGQCGQCGRNVDSDKAEHLQEEKRSHQIWEEHWYARKDAKKAKAKAEAEAKVAAEAQGSKQS